MSPEPKDIRYCDQGHPPHDARVGCGPCADEEDAGYGARSYALPEMPLLSIETRR